MSNNSNDDEVGKRAPGERDDDDDAPKRIQNLIEAGQTQEALFLRAQQQLEHHHQSQPYPALDSAQQQLAVAIARRKQSEQEVYLRQQEVQQAATMAELASRQHQQHHNSVGPAALLASRKYFLGMIYDIFTARDVSVSFYKHLPLLIVKIKAFPISIAGCFH